MSKNGLRRHYDRLTAEERFRLDVLAMARGDKRESERLVSSCPRATYTLNDKAFTGRWLGILDMTLRLYLEVAAHLERLTMVSVARAMLPYQDNYARLKMEAAFVEGHAAGARQAWKAAKGKGRAPELPLQGVDEAKLDEMTEDGASVMPEILDGLERLEAENALTVWRGFGAFSAETLELDPLKVLRVVIEPGAARIEALEDLAERLDIEPDAERAEEIRATLTEAWAVVDGRAA